MYLPTYPVFLICLRQVRGSGYFRQHDQKTKNVSDRITFRIVFAMAFVKFGSFQRSPGISEFVISYGCLK